MKRKETRVLSVLSVILLCTLTGCGKSESAMQALEERVGGKTQTESKEFDKEETKAQTEEKEKKQPSNSGDSVRLGDDCAGYQGFSWLSESELQKTADNEEEMLTIFLPKGGNRYEGETYSTSYNNGIGIYLNTDDYITYEQENNTPAENLELVVKNTYGDYRSTDKEGRILHEMQEIEDGAWQRVDYLRYDSYDEAFECYSEYVYLKQTDDFMLYGEFKINLEAVDSDTDAVMEELASFYGFDNQWDADEMTAFLQEYTGRPEVWEVHMIDTYNGLYMELPRKWDHSYDFDESNLVFGEYSYVYAADADAATAESYIEVSSDHVGTDYEAEYAQILAEPEKAQTILKDGALDGEKEITFSTLDTKVLGEVAVIESKTTKDGSPAVSRIYIAYQDGKIYGIRLVQLENAKEDAQIWLDQFFEEGVVVSDSL